jgi:hypothetical protein
VYSHFGSGRCARGTACRNALTIWLNPARKQNHHDWKAKSTEGLIMKRRLMDLIAFSRWSSLRFRWWIAGGGRYPGESLGGPVIGVRQPNAPRPPHDRRAAVALIEPNQ